MLSNRVNRVGMSPTLRISAAAKALRAQGVDVVDLSIGEPDFPTPNHVKDAAKKALDDDKTGYTPNDGIPQLKSAIINKFRRDNLLSYEPEQVIVSPGAKFSLYLACQVLLNKGEEALIPAPYWVSYPEQVALTGAKSVVIPTREEDGFKLSPERLRASLTFNTKLIFLNYPSNPCGATYTRDELAAIGQICREEGIYVLADEIYEKLTYDGHHHVSIAALDPELAKRTVVINGLSKAYSMTGWRIGYAAGPKDVIRAMAKVQSHATSNATSIAQYAGVAAIEGPQGDLARMNAEMLRRRNTLVRRLNALDGVSCTEPHGAFYLFPNVEQLYDKSYDGCSVRNAFGLSYYLLKKAHVAVVPGDPFGAPAHIRLSYATSMDRLEEGMARIAEALERLERPRVGRSIHLDNVITRVDTPQPVEVSAGLSMAARLSDEANRTISDDRYFEWNANISGIVVQLRTNSPHLYDFWVDNWYPAQLETDLEPHAVVYGIKGLGGRQAGGVYCPEDRTGFVINTAHYGQLRSMAMALVGDAVERMNGTHMVRAAAVDLRGRGLLLMGGPGSGLSTQLWTLLKQPGVRLVSADTVFVRHSGGSAVADAVERKFYIKTKWAKHHSRLAGLFDRSRLENVLTGEHSNELCDGGEACPVTRGQGACYTGSNVSRAMLDPYWLGGTERHVKRTQVAAVAIFRRDPVGTALQELSTTEAVSALEHPAPVTGTAAGMPWLNDNLLDTSAGRMDGQRRLFERLMRATRPVAINTAYTDPSELTRRLLGLLG